VFLLSNVLKAAPQDPRSGKNCLFSVFSQALAIREFIFILIDFH
jgi:hypothetical protein